MSSGSLFKVIVFIIFFLSQSLFAKELKKISLQLSWFDQFQFAGYYIAKEKGFYEDAGFDVEIKPFEFGLDIPLMVSDGDIDFAVGRETLILERTKNRKIVALYALFQSTPLILLSTKESGINTIDDFKYKRVMTTIDDSSEVSLKAMISSHKVKLDDLNFLMHTHNINDLIKGNTDVISAYLSKSPFELQKKGIEYNVFDPKQYGFDMYSDFLFTSEKLISQDEETVELFKKASLKGWRYAYENIPEAVDLITNKYNGQFLSKEELTFEADELKKLSYFDTATLGKIKKEKIQRIYDLYNIMGLIPKKIDIDKFLYDEYLNNMKRVNFNRSQKEYISNNKIVKICSIPNIKPYSFVENDELKGFVADYFKLIENETTLAFKFIKTNSFSQSFDYLEQRKCDVLTTAEELPNRKEFANFTKPYFNIPLVLTTKSNTTFIEDLSLIRNKKIGIIEGYSSTAKIKKEYPNIDFVYVKDLDEGFDKVVNDELFGHIDLLYTSWYKLYTNNLNNLRISGKLDLTIPVSIAVRNDDIKLLEILDIAVKNIDNLKKDELFKKWVTIDYKKETDYAILWKIIAFACLLFLAILYRQKLLKDNNLKLEDTVNEKNIELLKINSELEEKIRIEVDENLKKDRLLSQQSKMIAMGQMIENIAHQWRQPLSIITTQASSLKIKNQMGNLDFETIENTIDSIMEKSNYLSNTIDDFRYFFEPNKVKEEFSLNSCCKKTLSLVESSLKMKKIEIHFNSEKELNLYGYENELIQVLINILNNSKDALLLNNSEPKLIFIDIFEIKDKAVIEIKDNANGIKESIIDKIYEPYFTTKHKSQGTGIGLYMCEQIITKHMDGKINTLNVNYTYENKKYKGALTSIILDKI